MKQTHRRTYPLECDWHTEIADETTKPDFNTSANQSSKNPKRQRRSKTNMQAFFAGFLIQKGRSNKLVPVLVDFDAKNGPKSRL